MKVTKTKRILFSIAIAFVSVFFFAYAVQAFYPAPQYEDYCQARTPQKLVQTQDACEESGGKWIETPEIEEESGWCEINFACEQEYEAVRLPYEKKVFFANIIIGVIVFVTAFFLALEAVSSGLMAGSVMLIIYGSMRYWNELSDVWRTMMLGIALTILIYIGYKKLRD